MYPFINGAPGPRAEDVARLRAAFPDRGDRKGLLGRLFDAAKSGLQFLSDLVKRSLGAVAGRFGDRFAGQGALGGLAASA